MFFIDCFNISTLYKNTFGFTVSITFDCSFGTYNDVFIDCFLIKFPLYKNTFGCNVSITFDCSFGTYNVFH